MSVYHLHARLFVGVLADLDARYEFQSSETDDPAEATATATAKELAGRGFTVVIYDHGHRPGVSGASDYRQVAKFWPDGRVDRTIHI